ncbi:MAG: YlxR family protein [Chloroflexi bacterium]|nr:YlxR family protein [Chloroflexota bacterium]
MLRIVRAPDGTVRLDVTGRSAGRGAYVCRDAACIAGATGRGLLSRALVSPIPAALASELAAAMTTPPITSTPGGFVGQE